MAHTRQVFRSGVSPYDAILNNTHQQVGEIHSTYSKFRQRSSGKKNKDEDISQNLMMAKIYLKTIR